jgi:hypothetical protein
MAENLWEILESQKRQLRDLMSRIDPSDPESVKKFEQVKAVIQAQQIRADVVSAVVTELREQSERQLDISDLHSKASLAFIKRSSMLYKYLAQMKATTKEKTDAERTDDPS